MLQDFFKYCIWLMLCHMCRQILLPWQMLFPMFVADVIAIFIILFYIEWQMLYPFI